MIDPLEVGELFGEGHIHYSDKIITCDLVVRFKLKLELRTLLTSVCSTNLIVG